MATPSRLPRRDAVTTQRTALATVAELPPLPYEEGETWCPMSPDQIIAVLVRYDKTAAVYMTLVIAESLNYGTGRPGSAKLTDKYAAKRANVTINALAKIKTKLAKDGMITKNEDGSVSPVFPRLRSLAAAALPPMREVNKTECRPRTVPEREVVMVRVPGTLAEVPINDACSNAGGLGAKCACVLHAISAQRSTDSKDVTEKVCSSRNISDNLVSHSPPTSPPPKSEPLPAERGPVSADVLRKELAPLCMEVFGEVAATGPLWKMAAAILASVEDIPAMRDKIEACRGKSEKKIGLLKDFAREIAAERALNIPPLASAPPEPERRLSPFERADREKEARRGKKR